MFIDPYDTAGNISAGFIPPWIDEIKEENEPKKCACCMQLTGADDGEFLTTERNGLPPYDFYCYICIDAKE